MYVYHLNSHGIASPRVAQAARDLGLSIDSLK
jgi:hypothetical protein